MLPYKFRRSTSVAIPVFTTLLLWGIIAAFFGVGASTNIAKTGVTIGFLTGVINAWLAWMIWKHRVP